MAEAPLPRRDDRTTSALAWGTSGMGGYSRRGRERRGGVWGAAGSQDLAQDEPECSKMGFGFRSVVSDVDEGKRRGNILVCSIVLEMGEETGQMRSFRTMSRDSSRGGGQGQ